MGRRASPRRVARGVWAQKANTEAGPFSPAALLLVAPTEAGLAWRVKKRLPQRR